MRQWKPKPWVEDGKTLQSWEALQSRVIIHCRFRQYGEQYIDLKHNQNWAVTFILKFRLDMKSVVIFFSSSPPCPLLLYAAAHYMFLISNQTDVFHGGFPWRLVKENQ